MSILNANYPKESSISVAEAFRQATGKSPDTRYEQIREKKLRELREPSIPKEQRVAARNIQYAKEKKILEKKLLEEKRKDIARRLKQYKNISKFLEKKMTYRTTKTKRPTLRLRSRVEPTEYKSIFFKG